MKKVVFFIVLILMLALAGCSGKSSGTNSTGEENKGANKGTTSKDIKVLKFGSTDKKDVAMGQAMYEFEKIVEKETNGSIDVQVFPDSQLGGERDIFEGIQLGSVQGGSIGSAVITNFSPRFNLWSLPFMFDTRETAYKALDGDIGKEVLGDLNNIGVVGLEYWISGVRNLTNNAKKVKTPDDVKGLKLRTMESPIQLDVWKELGASPTPMAFPELFTALQQGVIDGQENPYGVIAEANFFEVQKYVSDTKHLLSINPVVFNKKFWDSLTEKEQDAIKKAAVESRDFERKLNEEQDGEYLEMLKEKGMTVTTLTPEERQKWVEKVQPVYDKYKKEIGEDIVNKLMDEVKK